jgi:hypothetical protein
VFADTCGVPELPHVPAPDALRSILERADLRVVMEADWDAGRPPTLTGAVVTLGEPNEVISTTGPVRESTDEESQRVVYDRLLLDLRQRGLAG